MLYNCVKVQVGLGFEDAVLGDWFLMNGMGFRMIQQYSGPFGFRQHSVIPWH